MAGYLTTHVLDTMRGVPAAGMTVQLFAVDPETRAKTELKTVITNSDGRTDAPMLAQPDFAIGVYELVFWVGTYYANLDKTLPTPTFLDRVPIQFGMADPTAHYHVPLLVSPWAYSTYRGS